ncbi:MAG TPA: cysteine dioxygenase family protein [Pyrinomonadaceae bacterium]|nr:cysteine dioxygenase family protein [Pyrinomonadaceae bacterium]
MERVSVDKLIAGLKEIPDDQFTCEGVYDFLGQNPVEVDSILRYFTWKPEWYTRNLIYRDDRFEMMAICWEPGHESRIHNHSEQKCWMTVPVGKLWGQNFAVEEIDESRGYCRLRETDTFTLAECQSASVELEEPVHQVGNSAEWNERAVSVHIYSRPYDRCLSYCRDTHTFKEVVLTYDSIAGKPCYNSTAKA